jgi:hypothetical protein
METGWHCSTQDSLPPSTMASCPVHSQVLWRWQQGSPILPSAPPSSWAVSLPTGHHAQLLAAGTQSPLIHPPFSPTSHGWGEKKGRWWGQPQGPEQALDGLGSARCQAEEGTLGGIHASHPGTPFQPRSQNCPSWWVSLWSVCSGGCATDRKKQPEGREGNTGRDDGWGRWGRASGALSLPCVPSANPSEESLHSYSLPAWTRSCSAVPVLRRKREGEGQSTSLLISHSSEFELRASYLLGKRYHLSPFCFSYFSDRVSHYFCPSQPGTVILLPIPPA